MVLNDVPTICANAAQGNKTWVVYFEVTEYPSGKTFRRANPIGDPSRAENFIADLNYMSGLVHDYLPRYTYRLLDVKEI